MHYSIKPPAGCRNTIFNIAGSQIPTIQDGSPAEFLGKPIEAFIPRDIVTVEKLKQLATKIMLSKRAPWQRIECLKTFYYLSLMFLMRTDQLSIQDWQSIDNCIRPAEKRTLGLPHNAANEYLFGASDDALFRVPLAAEDSDIAIIERGGGSKLLTSKDYI